MSSAPNPLDALFPKPALRPVDPEDGAKLFASSNLDPSVWIMPARRRRTLNVERAAAEARALGVHPVEIREVLLGGDYNLAELPFPEFEATVDAAIATVSRASTAAVALANAGGSPKMFTAADLLEMQIAPPNWLIDRIIPEGTTIIAGKPKSGKSFFALQAAIALCAGTRAFGAYDVLGEPGTGLYIGLDPGGLGGYQQRVRSMLVGPNGHVAAPGLSFVREWERGTEGVEKIGEWLEANEDARIVVVDTLGHFRKPPDAKMSPYDEDYAATSEISKMITRYGVSCFIIHHTSKRSSESADTPMDLLSGTTGLLGGVENGAVIMNTTRGPVLAVQPREFEATEQAMERDSAGLWQILGDAAEIHLSAQKKLIVAALKKEPTGLTTRDVMQEIDASSEGGVRRQLGRLRDEDGLCILQNKKWIYTPPREQPEGEEPAMSPAGEPDKF